MREFIYGIFIGIVPALIVSVLTAYVTVRLSLKQFHSQKWWELKSEAYSRIIEHLSYLQYYFGEWFDATTGDKNLSNKSKEELSTGYRQARESIERAAAIGAYIVSADTATALEELMRELNRKDSTGEALGDWIGEPGNVDRCYWLVKECIAKIRECAKSDLQKR